MNEKLLNFEEAAEVLGIAVPTLRTWVREHRIPHTRIANHLVRFRAADLDAWLETRSVRAAAQGQE
jgi:excisionase family DNA binding protein